MNENRIQNFDLNIMKQREDFLKNSEIWKEHGNIIDPNNFSQKIFYKHIGNFLTYVERMLKIKTNELEKYGEKEIIQFLFEFGKFRQTKKHFLTHTRIDLPLLDEDFLIQLRKFVRDTTSNYDSNIIGKIQKNLTWGITYAIIVVDTFDGNLSNTDPIMKIELNRMYISRLSELMTQDIKLLRKSVEYKTKLISPNSTNYSLDNFESKLKNYSWQEAEDIVGKLFEKKGYVIKVGIQTDSGKTKRTGDYGIDVRAKNASEYLGIQVKHWENDVGFEDVAKTLGVSQKFNKVIIISTKSGFTTQALNHGADNHYLIELWNSEKFKEEVKNHLLSEPQSKPISKSPETATYIDQFTGLDLAKIED